MIFPPAGRASSSALSERDRRRARRAFPFSYRSEFVRTGLAKRAEREQRQNITPRGRSLSLAKGIQRRNDRALRSLRVRGAGNSIALFSTGEREVRMTDSAVVADSHAATATARSSTQAEILRNFVGGRWVESRAREFLDVYNPARGEVIARTPLSTGEDLDAAVAAAKKAFPGWRDTPAVVRARALFRFRDLLEQNFEELARTVTAENGKTIDESRGSVRRGIECVEVACGSPSLMMGYGLENISSGIDCQVIRQPVGVCAAIAPFNFPAMVPLWFLPFAVGTGNTIIVKPSEQVPLSMKRMFELLENCDLPPGVVNLVNGGRAGVGAVCDPPPIPPASFRGCAPGAP